MTNETARLADIARRLERVLRRVDAGELKPVLTNPGEDGKPEWCGYPTYGIEDFEICVFDDCGEWDYMQWARLGEERFEFTYGVRDPDPVTRIVSGYTPKCLSHWGYECDADQSTDLRQHRQCDHGESQERDREESWGIWKTGSLDR